MLNGILLIDKPAGISSFDVIRKLKKSFYEAGFNKSTMPKMGHGGTLDPFATGLLVILLGEAAKLSSLFLDSVKTYEGEIVFGASTSSGDIDTEVEAEAPLPSSYESIHEYAQNFLEGSYFQKPPMYSAKKINGKKLYELARKNQVVEREVIERKIFGFEIQNYQGGQSKFKVSCSSGTYVRVLAEDLAKKMDSLAHLKSLRRLGSGDKTIEESISLEELEMALKADPSLEKCSAYKTLINCIPEDMKLELPEHMLEFVAQGRKKPLDWVNSEMKKSFESVFLVYDHSLVAWVKHVDGKTQYQRVFTKASTDQSN